MKKQIFAVFFLLAVIVISSSTVWAWNDAGHKLVAYIAWQQMTPAARQQAIKILRSAPEDSDLSVYFMADSRSEAARNLELFMIASTWADIVRDQNFKVRYEKYHHGTWHYLDTLWRETNGKVEVISGTEAANENAVERLFAFNKLLRDSAAPNSDKAVALAWMEHLIGDIHQPLHASGRVTDLEPKGDQGGNTFLLTPKDTPREQQLNLHWFWDSIVGRNVPRQNDACDADYLPAIAGKIMTEYPFSKMQNKLDLGKYDEWQKDSFRIASREVYPASLKRYETPSDDYKKKAFQIAQQQIALAGYRLGETLNLIFAK